MTSSTFKWRDMTFDELLEAMRPRIEFHCRTKANMVEGMEYDDVYQELSIYLWKLLDRIPKGIEYFDYRFTRYCDRCFTMRLFELRRSKMRRSLYEKKIYCPKDLIDHCSVSYEDVASLVMEGKQDAHLFTGEERHR